MKFRQEDRSQHHDRILCGWRVRSSLALPELLPWPDDDSPIDVEIDFGQIIEPGEAPLFVLPHSRLWADGAFLLALDGVGRYWVEGGRRVVIEPAPGIAECELRVFLLGTVLGVLCHQRGLLPIHASAVRMDGRAVLIAGVSGAGKSTLAAALGARGHVLAADDVTAVDTGGTGTPMALPAFPQRKLGRDVLEALGVEYDTLLPNRTGQPKYCVPAREDFDPTPLQPAAIYILGRAMSGQIGEIERFAPPKAMAQLDLMIYRRGVGGKIQPRPALFRAIARLAQAVPVYLLPLGGGLPLADIDLLAQQVESHARVSTLSTL